MGHGKYQFVVEIKHLTYTPRWEGSEELSRHSFRSHEHREREKSSLDPNKHSSGFSLFHRAFFNSIMDKTPTHALFTQHYISLAC